MRALLLELLVMGVCPEMTIPDVFPIMIQFIKFWKWFQLTTHFNRLMNLLVIDTLYFLKFLHIIRIICNSFFLSWNWEIWKKIAKLTRKLSPRDCWQHFEVWLLFKRFLLPLHQPLKKTSPKVNWITEKKDLILILS